MICKTNRPGRSCILWDKKNDKCNSSICEKASDECKNCKHVCDDGYCNKFISPSAKWKILGGCPMDTNKIVKEEIKHKLNPIKASKKKGKKL
ncbi:MAG: hypothetical protein WC346_04765 [Methanogenium sp.]|jgi:hypothetical protein